MANYHAPEGGPTIQEIADALGLSKTTVSRAISGKGRVSPQTRTAVREYLAKQNARAASRPATHNISLVIPRHFNQLDLPFLRKCMGSISQMAAQRGYDLLLCYTDPDENTQLERQLAAQKVDGVIFTRTLVKDPCLEMVQRYGIPSVSIGRRAETDVCQVDNDNQAAAEEMTALLLQMGMRRIAFLCGSVNYTVTVDRLQGYLRAMSNYGIRVDRNLMFTDIETEAARTDALAGALEQRPDCLLCADDREALRALRYFQSRGVRVPGDICIASLYDSEGLSECSPPISAIQFDAASIGMAACTTLLDLLAGKEVPLYQQQGHQVILRQSTAPKRRD